MSLLKGAIDFHYHAGPALFPRAWDYIELVKKATEAGLRAVVVKDHHYPTASLAAVLAKHTASSDTQLVGSVVLNNHVGGWNPYAVESALNLNARVIWMPTLSAEHHIEALKDGHGSFPKGQTRLVEQPLKLLNSDGKIRTAVQDILRLIAAHNAVLATGHLSPNEIAALLKAARNAGVERIVVDHPDFIIGAAPDAIEEFARQGAYIEFIASAYLPASRFYSYPAEHLFECIRSLGSSSVILSSDLGQAHNPTLVEGLETIAQELLALGLKERELEEILSRNPAAVLGLDNIQSGLT